MKHINHKGFSLLEILLTITLLSILFAILVNSINPNNILSGIQDNQREADALTIYQALEQYALKNNTYPEAIKNMPNNSSAYICKTSAPNCNNTNQINLSTILVPTYLSKIPEYSTDTNNSGFYVVKDSNGKIGIGGIRRLDDTTFVKGLESQSFATAPTTPKLAVTSCTYADKKISISYTSGEVGYNYASQTINSTGVTGLTATLTSGTLSASGTLEYEVTGTPSGGGTANFNLSNISNIGVGCNNSNIAVNVTETVLDSNYNNVALLINGNGTNGSTSIIDSSSNSNTVAAFGNSQISNVQSKFGGSSVYFDGSGDYLQTAANAGLALGSGSFTIEAWVRPANTTAGYRGIVGDNVYSAANGFALYQNGTAIEIWFGGSPATRIINATNCLTAGEYQHIAWTRSSTGVNRLFVNGVQRGGDSTNSTNLTATTLRIGRVASGSSLYDFNGYIDDLRITKGVARYTSDFSSSLPAELPTSGNTLTY